MSKNFLLGSFWVFILFFPFVYTTAAVFTLLPAGQCAQGFSGNGVIVKCPVSIFETSLFDFNLPDKVEEKNICVVCYVGEKALIFARVNDGADSLSEPDWILQCDGNFDSFSNQQQLTTIHHPFKKKECQRLFRKRNDLLRMLIKWQEYSRQESDMNGEESQFIEELVAVLKSKTTGDEASVIPEEFKNLSVESGSDEVQRVAGEPFLVDWLIIMDDEFKVVSVNTDEIVDQRIPRRYVCLYDQCIETFHTWKPATAHMKSQHPWIKDLKLKESADKAKKLWPELDRTRPDPNSAGKRMSLPGEAELAQVIQTFCDGNKMPQQGQRKFVEKKCVVEKYHIRGGFKELGFGTFDEFIKRNNINIYSASGTALRLMRQHSFTHVDKK